MRRRTQTEQFKICFPEVNLKTAQGMLMFQGFLAGYNKAVEGQKTDHQSYKKTIHILKTEVEELKGHISGMKLLAVNPWDFQGEEA